MSQTDAGTVATNHRWVSNSLCRQRHRNEPAASSPILGNRSVVPLVTFLSLFFVEIGTSWAGNNVGGTAQLSWAPATVVTSCEQAPGAEFQLYVLVNGAPDLQGLAISLKWTPADSASGCYALVGGAVSSSCGTAAPVGVPGMFGGDSSYTWSITFPPGADRRCVTYRVSAAGCIANPPPATFYMVSARAKDSNGAIDELVTGAPLTIAQGVSGEPPLSISALSTTQVRPGALAVLAVRGTSFTTSDVLELRSGATTVRAEALCLGSSDALTARIDVPDTALAAWIVVVRDTSTGTEALAPVALSVADTTALTGTGTNGLDWPIDKVTRDGILRKLPGSSDWQPAPIDSVALTHEFTAAPSNTQSAGTRAVANPARATQPLDANLSCEVSGCMSTTTTEPR